MPKQKVDFTALNQYLPPGSFDALMGYIYKYEVQLTVTKERRSVLGDYRAATNGQHHRISINGNLNAYAFLITLLHELAHLFTYEEFGNKVAPHGKEWKHAFGLILKEFLMLHIFPENIKVALNKTLHNPGASSCADEGLMRTLRLYDDKTSESILVEHLKPGQLFATKDGRIFRMNGKVRKRFKCEEVATKKLYLFSGLYEIVLLEV